MSFSIIIYPLVVHTITVTLIMTNFNHVCQAFAAAKNGSTEDKIKAFKYSKQNKTKEQLEEEFQKLNISDLENSSLFADDDIESFENIKLDYSKTTVRGRAQTKRPTRSDAYKRSGHVDDLSESLENDEADRSNPKDLDNAIVTPNCTHTASIIFLHGLGGTGKRWAPVLRNISKPYMKIICPTAYSVPFVHDFERQYLSWYNMTALLDDASVLTRSTSYIHSLIDEEISHGIPPEKIIVGGFTQGGVLALNSAITYKKKLGGIVSICSYIPEALSNATRSRKNRACKNIPILQCDRSPICESFLNVTKKVLHKVSNNVLSKLYEPSSNILSNDNLNDMKIFFETYLKPNKTDLKV